MLTSNSSAPDRYRPEPERVNDCRQHASRWTWSSPRVWGANPKAVR